MAKGTQAVQPSDSATTALSTTALGAATTRASRRAAVEKAELDAAEKVCNTVRSSKEKALKAQVWLQAEGKASKTRKRKADADREAIVDSEETSSSKRVRGRKAAANAVQNTTKQKPARRVLPHPPQVLNAHAVPSEPLPAKPIITAPKRIAIRQLPAVSNRNTASPATRLVDSGPAETSEDDSDEYADNNSEASSEDDDDIEDEDDLSDLAPPLLNERPTWVADIAEEDEGDTLDDIALIPDVPRSPSPSSDGASTPYVSDGEQLDLASVQPKKSSKASKKKDKGKGKAVQAPRTARQAAAEEERPWFKSHTVHANTRDAREVQHTGIVNNGDDNNTLEDIVDSVAVGPAVEDTSIELVFNEDGRIGLRDQHPIVLEVMVNVTLKLTEDCAFHHGIYGVDARFVAQRAIAMDVASNLGHPDVRERIRTDLSYAKEIVNEAEHRLILMRGRMKKTAAPMVPMTYQLVQGESAQRVAALLIDMLYAVPGSITNRPDGNRIFDVQIITQVIASTFFQVSARTGLSIAQRYEDQFVSSIRTKPDELEIPEAMLALACVAVYSALSDWSSGSYTRAIPFNVGAVEHEYNLVLESLEKIKKRSIVTYHRLMHKVYLNASTYTRAGVLRRTGPSAVEGVLQRILFDDDD